MTTTAIRFSPLLQHRWPLVVFLATIVLTLGVLTAVGVPGGWIVLVIGASVPLAWSALQYPQLLVALSVFLLFSNIPVVAVKFHGVPKIVSLLGVPAALGAVWLHQLVVHRRPLVLPYPWHWALAFLGVQVLSAMLARHAELAIGTLQEHLVEGFGLLLIICNVVRTRKCLEYVVIALLLAGSLLGSLSLYQQVTGTHRNEYGGLAQVPEDAKGFETGENRRQYRSAGSLGEKNRYAQNMLMLLPLAILPLSATRTQWQTIFYLTSSLLISAGCILAFSRGAIVACVVLMLLMRSAGYLRTRHIMLVGAAAFLFVLLFPQLLTRMEFVTKLVGQARHTGGHTEDLDGAITGRATAMLAALRATADYPLLGVGPGNFPSYYQEYAKVGGFRARQEDRAAHNLYLHLSAEYGLIGLAVFLAMVAATFLCLHQVWVKFRYGDPVMAGFAAGFAMAILAYLLSGMFLHFSFIRFFWLILGLACSIPVIVQSEERQRHRAVSPGAA